MSEPLKRYVYSSHTDGMVENEKGYYVHFYDWQSEHAARLAAEEKLAALQRECEAYAKNLRGQHEIVGATYATILAERDELQAQLAAERARSAKLVEALKMASASFSALNFNSTAEKIDSVLAAYQSSKENGK